MNNLVEEDENEEEELPRDEVGDVNDSNESQANGAHLSGEVFFGEQENLNGSVGGVEPPTQNRIISHVNGFKAETCI